MWWLMSLEESKGVSVTWTALYLTETLTFSDAFSIPSVNAFDALQVIRSNRQPRALPTEENQLP